MGACVYYGGACVYYGGEAHDLPSRNANRALRSTKIGLMAYINYAPMRIGAEDPWALTELAKAGGPWGAQPRQPRGGLGGTPN